MIGALRFDTAVIGVYGLTSGRLFDDSIEDPKLKRIPVERSMLKFRGPRLVEGPALA